MNVTVLGAGAWGTALGWVLHQNGHAVTLWGHDAAHLATVAASRSNELYLPGIALPESWRMEPDLGEAIQGASLLVVAVPSKAFRGIIEELPEDLPITVSVTKGIEFATGLTMSGILESKVAAGRIAALSGPSLALEVARGVPTAIVAASVDSTTAAVVQGAFHRPSFRVYTGSDVRGVELGGALKNVIAIAAGVCDGLGFGDNSKAALITRGIAEMRRLGVACGARAETFAGLSGLGDLTVTCFSRLSRNRAFGELLGRGETPEAILGSTRSVAEGVPTARAARELASKRAVETPIFDVVYAMLYEGKNAKAALRDLTERDFKQED